MLQHFHQTYLNKSRGMLSWPEAHFQVCRVCAAWSLRKQSLKGLKSWKLKDVFGHLECQQNDGWYVCKLKCIYDIVEKRMQKVYIYLYIYIHIVMYIQTSNSCSILHGMSCFVTTCMLVFVALSPSHIPLFEDFLSAFGVPFSNGDVHSEWMAS